MLKLIIICAFYTFTTFMTAYAEDNSKVAFGQSRPPYVMQDNQTGISIELFKRIYGELGKQFQPIYLSNARLATSLKNGVVDVAVEVKKTDQNFYYSDEFVSYQNFIIVRKNDQKQITEFSDLKGMTVCTWQHADMHLGTAFQEAMKDFKYREFPNQDAQVRVFLGGRCDAIIIDKKIFLHWTETLQKDNSFSSSILSLDFSYTPVPGQSKNPFFVGFKNEELKNLFNKELRKMKSNGGYNEVVEWSNWPTPPN